MNPASHLSAQPADTLVAFPVDIMWWDVTFVPSSTMGYYSWLSVDNEPCQSSISPASWHPGHLSCWHDIMPATFHSLFMAVRWKWTLPVIYQPSQLTPWSPFLLTWHHACHLSFTIHGCQVIMNPASHLSAQPADTLAAFPVDIMWWDVTFVPSSTMGYYSWLSVDNEPGQSSISPASWYPGHLSGWHDIMPATFHSLFMVVRW